MKKLELPPVRKSYMEYFRQFAGKGLLKAHAALYEQGTIQAINNDIYIGTKSNTKYQ